MGVGRAPGVPRRRPSPETARFTLAFTGLLKDDGPTAGISFMVATINRRETVYMGISEIHIGTRGIFKWAK